MGFIKFLLVAGILVVAGLYFYFNREKFIVMEKQNGKMKVTSVGWGHWVVTGLLVVFGLIVVVGSLVVINAGQVGVVVRFGKPVREMQAGINVKIPIIEKVSAYNIRLQNYTMTRAQNEGASEYKTVDDSLPTPTSEGITVGIDLTVLYRFNKNKATDIYRTITEYSGADADKYMAQNIIRPAIRNQVRMTVKDYTMVEVYGPKRSEVQRRVAEGLAKDFAEKNVIMTNTMLRDVSFPAEFAKAVNEKMIAQQKAQQKEYEIQLAQKEAERKVIEARGQAAAIAEVNATLAGAPNYVQWLWANKLPEGVKSIIVPQGSNILINPVDVR